MSLRQKEKKVEGEYYGKLGQLSGRVTGNILDFTWREGGAPGTGRFMLCSDGKSFAGGWGTGQDPMTIPWSGTR